LSTVGDLATELRSSIPHLYITVKYEMLYYNDKNHRELHLAAGDVHEVTSSEKGAVYSKLQLMFGLYRGAGKSLAPTRKETNYSDRRFSVSSILFIIITGGILVLYIYTHTHITKLTSKEIFSPSNKIHREVGRAKALSAPLY